MYFQFFFFKQKTAYDMRISDWSSDVCSSDLLRVGQPCPAVVRLQRHRRQRGRDRPVVEPHGVGEDDAPLGHDIQNDGLVHMPRPARLARRRVLAAADAEVEAMLHVLPAIGLAEPAPLERRLGPGGENRGGRRVQAPPVGEGSVLFLTGFHGGVSLAKPVAYRNTFISTEFDGKMKRVLE